MNSFNISALNLKFSFINSSLSSSIESLTISFICSIGNEAACAFILAIVESFVLSIELINDSDIFGLLLAAALLVVVVVVEDDVASLTVLLFVLTARADPDELTGVAIADEDDDESVVDLNGVNCSFIKLF